MHVIDSHYDYVKLCLILSAAVYNFFNKSVAYEQRGHGTWYEYTQLDHVFVIIF